MKDKIYYAVFFSVLLIIIFVGNLYQMKFTYWLYAGAVMVIFSFLKVDISGLGWFQKKKPAPVSNPGMSETAYQEIVAGYPDLNETEKKGYEKLCALCVGPDNESKVLQFISSLKDYRNDIDRHTTLNVLLDFLDESDIHFIMGLDWRSEVEDLDWRIRGAMKQNFNLEIDLPKLTDYPSDASVSFDHVFTDFDTPLRTRGFQMSFINEGSDSYHIIVHRITDKEEIVKSVEQIGYFYYDCLDDNDDFDRKTIYVTPPQKIAPKKNYLFIYLLIILLCPVFSFAVYKGYLKEGLSMSVVSILICNLIFYWIGIYGSIASWKKK